MRSVELLQIELNILNAIDEIELINQVNSNNFCFKIFIKEILMLKHKEEMMNIEMKKRDDKKGNNNNLDDLKNVTFNPPLVPGEGPGLTVTQFTKVGDQLISRYIFIIIRLRA